MLLIYIMVPKRKGATLHSGLGIWWYTTVYLVVIYPQNNLIPGPIMERKIKEIEEESKDCQLCSQILTSPDGFCLPLTEDKRRVSANCGMGRCAH